MTTWIARSLFAVLLSSVVPVASFAQGVDVGITGLGLISFQPIDESYVGSPYLSEGIGGAGPGFGGAISFVMPNGFVVMGELTTARFEQEQSGRLVQGPTDTTPVTTQLHDTIVSALIGKAVTAGRTRVQFLGGAGMVIDQPTADGVSIYETGIEEQNRLVLTGGIDLQAPAGSRAAFVISARYSYNERTEQAQFRGIGPHIFRVGAGIRVRLH